MIKAFEPAPPKHFKTPKYTGVFLSLLSMFVLASMFVVWEQIPKENEGPLLQVKVMSTLKQCMKGISPSFEKEMGVGVHFTYSADDKIVEEILSHDEEDSPFDLYIFQEPDNFANSSLKDQCVEKIPLVFIPPEHPTNSTDGSILVSANLSNRTQSVSLNGTLSENQPVHCGVPQGSILGPLLFLIYINDMNKALKKCKVYHFADDTNLLFSDPDPIQIRKIMNKELKLLLEWLCANRLSLNVAKTEFIIFCPPRMNPKERIFLELKRTKIFESPKIKYLGLILDSRLTWKFHIAELTKKT